METPTVQIASLNNGKDLVVSVEEIEDSETFIDESNPQHSYYFVSVYLQLQQLCVKTNNGKRL